MTNKENTQSNINTKTSASLIRWFEQLPETPPFNSSNTDSYQIISEIEFWLHSVSFSSFVKDIQVDVIGQSNLTLILANIYNYLTNIINEQPISNNMILTAPSGSGKTETYRAVKNYFKENIPSLPVYIQDLSRITATGYKGMEPSDLLVPFFNTNLDNVVGLVFLDEFDKKLIPSFNGNGQDINKEAQSCLLTILEGGLVQNHNHQVIDTSRIMFIGLGSFNECRDAKKNKTNAVGFESEFAKESQLYDEISKEDMINAGGMYELIGRFPIIINYNTLDEIGIRSIIHKITLNLETAFQCTILLSDTMTDYLISQANGDFGCRLIDSILRQSVLKEYAQSLSDSQENQKLEISFVDKNTTTYQWKELSEKELQDIELLKAFAEATNIPNYIM